MDFKPRPVLFRAWNIEEQKFNVLPYESRMESGRHQLVLGLESNLFDYYVDEPDCSCDYVDDKYVVTQSTGMVDKDGHAIFEGDVVKDTLCGKTAFVSAIENGWFPFHANDLYSTGGGAFMPKSVNVIGNLFQNPELVKKAIKA